MDQLPPELISVIVSHLDREAIGPYASLSRQWQVAVESITFRHLRLDSTDLNQFQRRLSIQHRRAALETLDYFASLPAYSDDRCAKVERRREREANNAAFTEAVNSLFTMLKNWEEDGNHRRRAGRPITLNLCALSPTDIAAPRPYDDMGEHRYERSILTLLDPCSLPQIERVVSFSALSTRAPQYKWSSLGWNLDCKPRTLRAASVAQIGSKFPNLTSIKWELEDCAFTEDTIRHKYRKEFADALSTIPTQHLERFTLWFRFPDPQNDAFHLPSGTCPDNSNGGGVDELSASLHVLLSRSPHLKHCTLSGPIALSPAIFGPTNPSPSAFPSSSHTSLSHKNRHPPSLLTLTISTGRTTPAGTWLYARDPSEPTASASDHVSNHSETDHSRSSAMTPPFHHHHDGSSNSEEEEEVDSDDSLWHETWHAWHAGLATGQRPRRRYRSILDAGAWEPFVVAGMGALLCGDEES
ncbi:F-box domain cyclin-like protein, partial [Macrophomina phaseolina MS6]